MVRNLDRALRFTRWEDTPPLGHGAQQYGGAGVQDNQRVGQLPCGRWPYNRVNPDAGRQSRLAQVGRRQLKLSFFSLYSEQTLRWLKVLSCPFSRMVA